MRRFPISPLIALVFACGPERPADVHADLQQQPDAAAYPNADVAPKALDAGRRAVADGPTVGQPCDPGRVACPSGLRCCETCCPWRFTCVLPVTSDGCPRSWDDEPWSSSDPP